jgi:hypothetical protein
MNPWSETKDWAHLAAFHSALAILPPMTSFSKQENESHVQNLLRDMQRYVANIGITASALRNLGAGDFVRAAREFLGSLDLNPLATLDPLEYPKWLDDQTQELMAKFPSPLWGPARKSINIFMTMASVNRFLYEAYALVRFECVLEVPLDNVVEKQLRAFGRNQKMFAKGEFPKWKSIKALDSMNSEKYQQIAEKMATERSIPRGRLDIALWRPTAN